MYNAHWIHSLPYSKFIELTLVYYPEKTLHIRSKMPFRLEYQVRTEGVPPFLRQYTLVVYESTQRA